MPLIDDSVSTFANVRHGDSGRLPPLHEPGYFRSCDGGNLEKNVLEVHVSPMTASGPQNGRVHDEDHIRNMQRELICLIFPMICQLKILCWPVRQLMDELCIFIMIKVGIIRMSIQIL